MNVSTDKALLARLRSRLRPSCLRIVRTDRVSLSHGYLGQYHLVDDRNHVMNQDVDLQSLESELIGRSQKN